MPGLEREAKIKIAEEIGFAYHPYRKALVLSIEGATAAIAISALVFAQFSKPGSTFYSVKQGTIKVQDIIKTAVPFVEPSKDDSMPKTQKDNKNKDSSRVEDSGVSGGSDSHTGEDKSIDDSSQPKTLGTSTDSSASTKSDDDTSGSSGKGRNGSVTISDLSGSKGKHGSGN